MTESIQLALSLLAIGMTTVFAILSLVVLSGRLVVWTSNRLVRETLIDTSRSPRISTSASPKTDVSNLAAIIGTVEHLTQGRGTITRIEKTEKNG